MINLITVCEIKFIIVKKKGKKSHVQLFDVLIKFEKLKYF